ncbi:FAD-dependent thymidylate synthase [Desulfurococcus mucosus]|uniref:Flavin-dependent thymidylate synthase n=1 Tax=Desulfurococcus mucosus (strain ATCC 35584 / DSM 2162 / JCM 9187 / O7/1) TaxID=765177 RepID=E8RAC4_DESM0|nr:FAD-dependent thymidylate synthase [Desulfurococcus mucosus]ADV65430.1 thymidylate synthase (FAD) [Desulfurococcus mucosus DSM 2162]
MCRHLPSARLVAYLHDSPRIIASASKLTLSPKDFTSISEGMSGERAEEWVRELVKRGHGSPLEHSLFVFEVVCSRACSHQLVRHRHASFSQLSQRYSDKYLRGMIKKACELTGIPYAEDYGAFLRVLGSLSASSPGFHDLLDVVAEAFIVPPRVVEAEDKGFLEALLRGVESYYRAVASGISFEDARYLLPQAVKTRLLVSMNARELLEVFIPLRTCSRAQWEVRNVAWQMLMELRRVAPELFKYAGPRCVLQDARVRAAPCTLDEYLSGSCTPTVERCPELVPRDRIAECIRNALRGAGCGHGDLEPGS